MIPLLKLPLSVDCQTYLLIPIPHQAHYTSCCKLVFSEPDPDLQNTSRLWGLLGFLLGCLVQRAPKHHQGMIKQLWPGNAAGIRKDYQEQKEY